ncbi:MAG: hypothetical protein LBU85_12100 [Treponema sp.]|jgi:hypothetical protein|nr:hypothetical protein [Treponema sp.]
MRKRNLLKALGTAVLPLVMAVFLTTCGEPFQPELRDITIVPATLSIKTLESLTIKARGVPSTGILKIDGVPAEYSVRWEVGDFDDEGNWINDWGYDPFNRAIVEITSYDGFSATIKLTHRAKPGDRAKIKAWLVNKDGEIITNDHGTYTATCTVSVGY